MIKIQRPRQTDNLIAKISECIKRGSYRVTLHALDRQLERNIDLPDVVYVLTNGYHEKKKTSFDEVFQTWKYVVRGKTLEQVEVRIILAFDEREMLIITVIDVTKERK